MSDLQLHGKQISGGPAAQRNTYTDAHGSDNSRVFTGFPRTLVLSGCHRWSLLGLFSVGFCHYRNIIAILPKESWQH